MTVTWPKTLAYSLIALVALNALALLLLLLGANDLRNAANAADAAKDRQECLTDEYKDFFAGVAQVLYAVVSEETPPREGVDRLAHAAEVLPMIDERCDS